MLPLVGSFKKHSESLQKGDHLAHFYTDPQELARHVATFALPAFTKNEGVIIIARENNSENIEQELSKLNVDVASFKSKGQLIILDSEETLSVFMKEGLPVAELFENSVGKTIQGLQQKYSHIRAYGEMVDHLWQQGNPEGTLRLERLWNRLALKYDFSLFCGYHLTEHDKMAHNTSFNGLCCSHSHVVTRDGNLRLVGAA